MGSYSNCGPFSRLFSTDGLKLTVGNATKPRLLHSVSISGKKKCYKWKVCKDEFIKMREVQFTCPKVHLSKGRDL